MSRRPSFSAEGARTVAALLLTGLQAVLGTIAGALLLALLTVVLAAVVMRYGFGSGLFGSEEAALWLYLALIALGAPLTLQGAMSMRVDALVARLPWRLRAVADDVADGITILAALTLLMGGRAGAGMMDSLSPALGLPEWGRPGLLAVSGGLLLLVLCLARIAQGRARRIAGAMIVGATIYGAASAFAMSVTWPPSAALALAAGLGLLAGAPLPHALLAGAHLALAFGSPLPEQAIVSGVAAGISKFLLLAIPFFLLMGGFLTASGMAGRLVRLAAALVGRLRGGLAQTTLLTAVMFSGASGSSIANAAFGATVLHPQLVAHGYRPERAAAIVAATSVLDNVIPPSIALLILAVAVNLPVGELLIGGLVAGLTMAVCLALAIHLTGVRSTGAGRPDMAFRWSLVGEALPLLGLGVIVVAGIRLGMVTTTEAAAVAAAYTLVLGLGSGMTMRKAAHCLREAAVEVAGIGLVIGSAAPLAFLLAVDGAGAGVVSLIEGWALSPAAILLVLNLTLLAAGLVLDIGVAILLLAPLMTPIAVAAGIDPVHFGVILVVNFMIGGLTPPFGILVLVSSGIAAVPSTAVFRAILPYLAALVAALGLLSAAALVFRSLS